MTPEQITKQLESLAFMFDLNDSLRRHVADGLAEVSRVERVTPGAILLSPENPQPDTGYVLLAGSVDVTAADGFERNLEPPVILGEMKQFHFEPGVQRMATLRAVCEVTVLRFTWPDLYAALATRVTPADLDEFRAALQDHAWMHYLELQDEL